MMRTIGVSFGLIGLGLLFYSLLHLVRAHRSQRWPVVNAEVIQLRIEETRGRRTRYEPIVRYRYVRNGVAHEGARILFVSVSLESSRDEAERFLAQFQLGGTLPIRVSPTNDDLSVIVPGIDYRWSLVGIVFGLAFISVGVSTVL